MNKLLNEIKGISPKSTKVKLLNVDERSSSDSLSQADAFDENFSTVGNKLANKTKTTTKLLILCIKLI